MNKIFKLLAISAMCFIMYPSAAQATYIEKWQMDRWVVENSSTELYNDMGFSQQSDADHIVTWYGDGGRVYNGTFNMGIKGADPDPFNGNPHISVGYDVKDIGWSVGATADAGNLYYFWKVPDIQLQGEDRIAMVLQNQAVDPELMDFFSVEFQPFDHGFLKIGVFNNGDFLGGTYALATDLINDTFGIRISWDSAGAIQAYYDFTTGPLGNTADPTTHDWLFVGSMGYLDANSGMHNAQIRATFNPEPSTLLLLSSTLLGLGLKRRKQRMLA